MTRRLLATLTPAPLKEAAAPTLAQTPGGILLPPGVAEKLSARAALAEAEALVAGLPTRSAEAVLLAEVQHLAGQVNALQTALERTERRVTHVQPVPPAPLRPCAPAQQLLARDPLFLDLETTGLKKTDRVIEVGLIDAQGRVLFSTLVNPGQPIPPESSAINGITDADVADAPAWEGIKPRLGRLLANRVIVAHNAKFEAKFLPADWPIAWTCSKQLADQILGKREGWGSLPGRLAQLGLEPGPAHSAAGDCLSVLRLVRCLAGMTEPVELNYQF